MSTGTDLDLHCEACGSLLASERDADTDVYTWLRIDVPVCIKCAERIEGAAYAEGFTAGQESMS